MLKCDDEHLVDGIRLSIQQALADDEIALISAFLPALATFLGKTNNTRKVPSLLAHCPEALVHFRQAFCTLVTSICSLEEPLILFLDDLQWADRESLELLSALLTDRKVVDSCGLIIMGACRDNEVSLRDDLALMLRDMEDNHGLAVTHVALLGLTKRDVLNMIADSFGLAPEECLSFSDYVYDACSGLPLHTVQLIRALHANNAIQVSTSKTLLFGKLKADNMLNEVGGNAQQLVANLIHRLPLYVQKWLTTAAFLGTEFDEHAMEIIIFDENKSGRRITDDSAERCILSGLINRVKNSGYCRNRFRFVHDVVQQASYELIEADKQGDYHFFIGMRLWRGLETQELVQQYAINIAFHVRWGLHLLETEQEKVEAAEMFLLAAKNASLGSSFRTAESLLRSARELLPTRVHWREYYTMSLDIFTFAAQMEYAIGQHDECHALCESIVANGRSHSDKISGCITKIHALGSGGNIQDAMNLGLKVLANLGESVPRNPSLARVVLAIKKTQGLLRRYSNQDIRGFPQMEDPEKLAAMQILNLIFTYAFTQKPTLQVVLVAKIIELTVKYGRCACSAVGFAFYSIVTSAGFKNVSLACEHGQLALDLLKDSGINEYSVRVYTLVHGGTNSAVLPLKECLESLHFASRCGSMTGDIEFGALALHFYSSIEIYQGTPLTRVVEKALQYRRSIMAWGQDSIALFHESVVQASAEMAGIAVPSLILNNNTMDRAALVDWAKKERNATLLGGIHAYWGTQLFWTGDFLGAMECFRKTRAAGLQNVLFIFQVVVSFMEGMACFLLAKESSRGCHWHYIRRGRKCLCFVQRHSRAAHSIALHRALLMEAALEDTRGNWQICMSKYNLARECARQVGMLGEQALALELLGRALVCRGSPQDSMDPDAEHVLCQSRDLYHEWGNPHKVQQLNDLMGS